MTNPISGVLLDVDGTLLDSNDAHACSWVDAFRTFGIPCAFEQIRPLIGMGGDRILTMWSIESASARGQAISAVRGQIFRDNYLPTLKPFPFVRPLLERMKRDGKRLVVASSATKDDLKGLLERAGVADLIDDVASSSDAQESKPAPDIILAALDHSGLRAAEVIMLGDTPYDVEAAGKACVPIIAVRSGGWSDADLAGAVAIYDDTRELLAHYGASILSPTRQLRRPSLLGEARHAR
jgi:phosphoglycolate phosphatase-like HAD superfamily hydrolase